jgi:hypothetical protein
MQVDDPETVNMMIIWFFFDHCINHLMPSIEAVAMSNRVLENGVMSRPNGMAGTIKFFDFVVVRGEIIRFDEGMVMAEVATQGRGASVF